MPDLLKNNIVTLIPVKGSQIIGVLHATDKHGVYIETSTKKEAKLNWYPWNNIARIIEGKVKKKRRPT